MEKAVENSEVKIIEAKGNLGFSPNSITVLEKRYLKKDEKGRVSETPEMLFKRVANNIAQADKIYDPEKDLKPIEDQFFRVMSRLEFMPNSPTLMNAGRKLQQLSACFVLPIGDSMESIFNAVKNTAMVHKSGGGTGFSFSRLRPKDDYVSSTYGLSSGPVSFMKAFDAATEAVNQGGFRRGANMGIMRVDHPDIMDFISCKEDLGALNNFNVSVALTDKFMEALEKDEEYDLVNPRNKSVAKKMKASDVFEKIVGMAWQNGEPGIVFLDEINRYNPTPQLGEIESTNPCGEQPLLPFEACNLGSINLSKMVTEGDIDYDKFKETIWTAVHFLDNVIDMGKFPLEEITEMVRGNRKIGLGVMGFADMLIQLGVPYNSERALDIADKVMGFIQSESKKASSEMAKRRGVFPNFKGSIYDRDAKTYVRNATTTTIAPTGSISIISNCSGGIEPLFSVCYWRNVLDGEKLVESNPYFEQIAKERGFYSNDLMENIAKKGSLKDIDEVPDDVKRIFITAHDISPEWHVRMQAMFQKHTDNAVSKTVNFHKDATKEEVKEVYQLAYKTGCKGVTVYRDQSRAGQVLTTGAPAEKVSEKTTQKVLVEKSKKHRPRMLTGKTVQVKTGCGGLYVTINQDEAGVFELFNTMGKAGGCASSQSEAIGRLVSLAWRSGISPEQIVKQLIGISCHKQIGLGKNKILSCADAIAKAIQTYMDSEEMITHDIGFTKQCGACPECGSSIEFKEGCATCKSCGFSECG